MNPRSLSLEHHAKPELRRLGDVADVRGQQANPRRRGLFPEIVAARRLNDIGTASLLNEPEFFPRLDLRAIGDQIVRSYPSRRKTSTLNRGDVVHSIGSPERIRTVVLPHEQKSLPLVVERGRPLLVVAQHTDRSKDEHTVARVDSSPATVREQKSVRLRDR